MFMMHKNHPLIESVGYALEGIKYAIVEGRNFKIQLGFAILISILGGVVSISPTEWLALILIIALVLILELINTAIETVVDMVSLNFHPLAKITKDCAAGAVLVASFASVLIGIIIFVPKLFAN
jgi:diacylglycerol kinase